MISTLPPAAARSRPDPDWTVPAEHRIDRERELIQRNHYLHKLVHVGPGDVLLDLDPRFGLLAIELRQRFPGNRLVVLAEDRAQRKALLAGPAAGEIEIVADRRLLPAALADVQRLALVRLGAGLADPAELERCLPGATLGHVCGAYDGAEVAALQLYRFLTGSAETFLLHDEGGGRHIAGWGSKGPEVSIVVPAYGVVNELPRCLASLVDQTLQAREIIVVDDGSTDGSGRVADEWAARHPEIRVIHKPNGGCASARSFGLAAARGAFVGFVDGDDWVEPAMLETLFAAAVLNQAEVAQCGYRKVYEATGTSETVIERFRYEPGDTFDGGVVARVTDMMTSQPAIWRRLYRRAFLRDKALDFDHAIRRFDDLPFQFEVFMQQPRTAVVHEALYNYRLERPGQDVAVDDDRLYVHFEIFARLHEAVERMGRYDLERELKKVQILTHQWAAGRIQPHLRPDYEMRAAKDVFGTAMMLDRRDFWRLVNRLPKGPRAWARRAWLRHAMALGPI